MEGASTRERALAAALELFGRKGYDGVSMADIAQAVGVRAPSLYKHFESKEALWAALIPIAQDHYKARWAAVESVHSQLEREVRVTGVLKAEALENETMEWVLDEMSDSRAYRAFARQAPEVLRCLWYEPVKRYEGFFERLMGLQALKRCDAHTAAVEYLAPIFLLVLLSERDPDRYGAVTDDIRAHIRQFHKAFAVKEKPSGGDRSWNPFRR